MSSTSSLEHNSTQQETHVSRPSLKLVYTSQGFCGPFPDYSHGHAQERISDEGSAPIVKISPDLVVKYGPHVKATEAESLLFLEQKAPGIPVPRVHACYTIGPFERDLDDFGSVYDTYIIMTFIEGHRLDQAWCDFDEGHRMSIAAQLRAYMQEMRSILHDVGPVIGSVANGPLQDPLFADSPVQGPFANEEDFNAALVSIHDKVMSKAHLRNLIEGALAQNKHQVVLTHGDLQGRNIMVSGDKITGLLDWESCGWYPEYWEFVKCFSVPGWPEDWPKFVALVLEPYYCQWAVYDLIKRHVW